MLRMRRLLISLVSALVAAGLVYGVYVMLLRQVELQETTEVIVPRHFIDAGTVLTDEMLERATILAASVGDQMVGSADSIIGKQTLIPLGAGEPVLVWKLSSSVLLPVEDEATFEIPREYVRSISGRIRPGDLVRIYVSHDGGGRRLLMQDVRVASVRWADSGRASSEQAEGADESASGNQEQLLRASRQVERINLNLTEEQWLTIDRACQDPSDGRLIIALPVDQLLATSAEREGADAH